MEKKHVEGINVLGIGLAIFGIGHSFYKDGDWMCWVMFMASISFIFLGITAMWRKNEEE